MGEAVRYVDKTSGTKQMAPALKERVVGLGLSNYKVSHWLCLARLENWVVNEAPLIIHITFEKRLPDGEYLIDKLLKDDRLRNLFETGHGCGSECFDARESWERRVFGDGCDDTPPTECPKYGTINLTNAACGVRKAAYQYGKSYLVLKNSLRWRCTMTNRDSSYEDAEVAFLSNCSGFCNSFSDDELTGIWNHDGTMHLKRYPEIQIHGDVLFERDVDQVVVHSGLPAQIKNKVVTFCSK